MEIWNSKSVFCKGCFDFGLSPAAVFFMPSQFGQPAALLRLLKEYPGLFLSFPFFEAAW